MSPLLLIAFKFPPFSGVGGFRWTKMVKYLARLGREVHVVSVDWDTTGPMVLPDDLSGPGIHIHRIASGFPHNDLHYKGVDPDRIALREAAHARMRELNIFDEAGVWGDTLIPFCQDLIPKHGIRVAAATGHPFHANAWAAELTTRTPGLRLIQDFRDLPSSILVNTHATKDDYLDLQQRCVRDADAVVTISHGMADIMRTETPFDNSRVIRNGYDPEHLLAYRESRTERANHPLSFCYLGSLGFGRHAVMETFLRAVETVVSQGGSIKVTLCGDNHGYIAKTFADLARSPVLTLSPSIPHDQAMQLAAGCDFGLNLLSPPMEHYLPTKIYDYLGMGLPCLSIGPVGDTSRLLAVHDCGVPLPQDHDALAQALTRWCQALPAFSFRDTEALGADRLAMEYNALIAEVAGETHG